MSSVTCVLLILLHAPAVLELVPDRIPWWDVFRKGKEGEGSVYPR